MKTTKNQFLSTLGLALLSACNSTPSESPKAPADAEIDEVVMHGNPAMTLPTPYTAEAIYAACPAGTTFVSRVQGPGQPTMISTTVFEDCTRERALISSTTHDTNGNLITEASSQPGTWEEMRDHASFPADLTTVQHKSRTGALGTHACKVYTIRDPEQPDQTTVFWFADELPGPPIFFASYIGDEMTVGVEMIERK